MKYPLIIGAEADDDLIRAHAWYEGRRMGLGVDLLELFESPAERITHTPLLWPKAYQELRLALLERFPYAIIYRFDDDQITIVAFRHTHSDPRIWQDRS